VCWVRAVKLKVEQAQCVQIFGIMSVALFVFFLKENQQDLDDGSSLEVRNKSLSICSLYAWFSLIPHNVMFQL